MTGVLGNVAGDCGDEIAASLIAKDLGVHFLRGSATTSGSGFCGTPTAFGVLRAKAARRLFREAGLPARLRSPLTSVYPGGLDAPGRQAQPPWATRFPMSASGNCSHRPGSAHCAGAPKRCSTQSSSSGRDPTRTAVLTSKGETR